MKIESPVFEKVVLFFLCAVLPLILAFSIQAKFFFLLLGFIAFAIFVMILYTRSYELFIVFVLAINEHFFSLVPRALSGKYSFQALLYVILPVIASLAILKANGIERPRFRGIVISLFLLTLLGAMNSFVHGQPLGLSLKAGMGYYLILFFFLFNSKAINSQKLSDIVIAIGAGLAFLNNIQYIFFGKLKIFDYASEMVRIGRLRFLIPEMFILFSAVLALSSYLFIRKKKYLVAFIYIAATIVLQGQTRVHIWGLFVMTLGLFILEKKLTILKTFFLAIPILVLIVWGLPLLKNTVLSKLFELTRYELSGEEGNISIRLKAYDYYFHETVKSPLIGRGIWNDLFDIYMGDNPEDMKHRGLHLSDIGIMNLFFHLGALGLFWLIWLLVEAAKFFFASFKESSSGILYGCAGYFLFSLATLPTLNCLTRYDSIIYLALFLALMSQNAPSDASACPALPV